MDTQELQKIIERLVMEALERRFPPEQAVKHDSPSSAEPQAAAKTAAPDLYPTVSAGSVRPVFPFSPGETAGNKPVIITKEDLESIPFGGTFPIPKKAILTDLAREYASGKQISLVPAGMKEQAIAIGADHGGYELKERLKSFLQGTGYPVRDMGTFSRDTVDYPDFALAVAMSVARHDCFAGIVLDGAGIGSCITANKVPGIRAACCWDEASARNSREHNFANVLTLGGRTLDEPAMRRIVKTWLETPYGEERHARRVKKISAIEAKYIRNVNL